jgi:4-amino-4-deoxychorismate lyase
MKVQRLWRLNGTPQAALPVDNRGLAYGDGLFETLRLASGRCAWWPWHSERLRASLARLGLASPEGRVACLTPTFWEAELTAFLAQLAAAGVSEGVIKLIVWRGFGAPGYRPTADGGLDHLWQWYPPVQPLAPSCLEVSVVRLAHQPLLAGMKHLNKLEYVLAAAKASAGLMPLLCDSENQVIESLSHNVFYRVHDRWYTPPLTGAGVAGVLRARWLESSLSGLPPLAERALPLEQLWQCDELLIGNSLRGFGAVSGIRSGERFSPFAETGFSALAQAAWCAAS